MSVKAVESMKIIRSASGDTFVRPHDNWGDRVVPIVWACIWLYVGKIFSTSTGIVQTARESGPFAPDLWLSFGLWLIVFALLCTWSAWAVFGMTKISVSSDELVVRHYICGERVLTSHQIKLSTIRDVFVKKYEGTFKSGTKWYHWMLIVNLKDDSSHEVAKFSNLLDVDEFMSRHVQ